MGEANQTGLEVLSHSCPKKWAIFVTKRRSSSFVMREIASPESSPEKAGVGGSIPSLATTF